MAKGNKKLSQYFPELLEDNVNFKDLLFGGFMAMCYYAYLVVIVADLSIFDCSRQLDGTLTMDVDPSIRCYQTEHAKNVPLAYFFFVVYGMGIPATLGWFLFVSRNQIHMDQALRASGSGCNQFTNPAYRTRKRYAQIYEQFKPQYFYWRLCLMLRKFLLASTTLFFSKSPMFQGSIAIGVLFFAYVMHQRCLPFLPRASISTAMLEANQKIDEKNKKEKEVEQHLKLTLEQQEEIAALKKKDKEDNHDSIHEISRRAKKKRIMMYVFDYLHTYMLIMNSGTFLTITSWKGSC